MAINVSRVGELVMLNVECVLEEGMMIVYHVVEMVIVIVLIAMVMVLKNVKNVMVRA